MVSGRTGFQKSYDLAKPVLPDDISREYPTDIETGRFFSDGPFKVMVLPLKKKFVTISLVPIKKV